MSAEIFIWLLRLAMLGGMLLLLITLVAALRADLRAAMPAPPPGPAPAPPSQAAAAVPTLLAYAAGAEPAGGRDYPLRGTLEIGRDPGCQIVLPNHLTSKRHARLLPRDGGWYVEDLDSTNGTLLNGHPLTAPHRCVPGDRLQIGETEFVLR